MWDLQALSNKQCLVYHDPNVRSSVLYCLKGIFADLESAHDLTQTQRQTYLMHHADGPKDMGLIAKQPWTRR